MKTRRWIASVLAESERCLQRNTAPKIQATTDDRMAALLKVLNKKNS